MSKRAKNILFGALAVLIMLVPTYIAIANYAVLGSWENTLTGGNTVIHVKEGTEGADVFRGSEEDDNNRAMAKALADMLKSGTALRSAPTMDHAEIYTVTAEISDKKRNYLCYYDSIEQESYLFDEQANVCYAVDSEDMLLFLQGFFYGETHESLSVPALITAGSEVVPYYISWNHKNAQGSYAAVTNLATASEEATYPVNKNLSLRFTTEPDTAAVTITDSQGIEIWRGNYGDFTGMSFEDSTQLTVMVQAKWNQRPETAYYGEATYQFYVNYSAQPAFAISKDRVAIGDFLVLSVLNATAPEDISFSCSPNTGCTPTFYEDGDYVRALVPFPAGLEEGVYQMTVSTKGAEETFRITLYHENKILTRTYAAGADLIASARSTEALNEYERLRREIGSTPSTTKYFNGTFVDYSSSSSIGAILMLGYGNLRTLNTGETYRMDGIDFVVYRGTDIPALNSGMVIAAGQSSYLGNYVIVDHGLGLRTWYCHLSEISVSVGDTVTSAQAVGKSGDTGFTTNAGVYLICTVGETPVFPYTLWKNGVVY